MKRFALILSLFSLLFISCGKGNDAPKSGTITASIDGVKYTFNMHAGATQLSFRGAPGIFISGYQKEANSTQLKFAVARTNGVQAGSYSENNTVALGTAELVFFDAQTGGTYTSHFSTSNEAVIIISEVTATSVKGSFSGDVFLSENGGYSLTTKRTITNGKFHLNF